MKVARQYYFDNPTEEDYAKAREEELEEMKEEREETTI